jgi:hypothetical protein
MYRILSLVIIVIFVYSQEHNYEGRRFEQLNHELRSPNVYRTASGAPGHLYWQQQVNYDIDVELNDEKQIITGSETITYINNSPDELRYLWVQLDQNTREKNSDTYKTSTSKINDKMSSKQLDAMMGYEDYDGGFKIKSLTDINGKPLAYKINWTMMRIDLPVVLKNGESFQVKIQWSYNINDRNRMGGRGGYEYFEDDRNYLYTITQWFPRMAVYSDFEGWQTKQFMGRGEFALPFGNYKVKITVPSDHIVASTGVLQNAKDVLNKTQIDRFEKSKTAKKPVEVVTLDDAKKNEKSKSSKKKTWIYHAEDVRDFAFGSSRKYIWDAMGVNIAGKTIMAMSYYPKEAYNLYSKYSTEVVAQTLKTYSKHTIDYPYPVAISVEATNGMEYPMICFNYGRPDKDGTYSERTKYGMIGVIIHEVGHNFFPMIINSDERQWTWMDEGLNTFVQFLTEQEWDNNYPSRRGPAHKIVPYMKGDKSNISPIMTNSEQVKQFGNNAYGKPATALNILRETVMGRELFDFAFKEYSRRWAFKHPTPEDLFRTMEDASGVDLDWFWKGWFFSTDHVDIAVTDVKWFKIDTKDPDIENKFDQKKYDKNEFHIAKKRNKEAGIKFQVDEKPYLNDFYNKWDRFEPTNEQEKEHREFKASLDDKMRYLLDEGYNFYEVHFENLGGLVMPIIIEFTYENGDTEIEHIPAEIWRRNEKNISKVFAKKNKVKSITLDPYQETADTDQFNNNYPRVMIQDRFEMFKSKQSARGASGADNPMKKAKRKN